MPPRIPAASGRPRSVVVATSAVVGAAAAALSLLAGLGWWSLPVTVALAVAPVVAARSATTPVLPLGLEERLVERDDLERRLGSALELARHHSAAESLQLLAPQEDGTVLVVTARRGHEPEFDRVPEGPTGSGGSGVALPDGHGHLRMRGGRRAVLVPLAARLGAALSAARASAAAEGLRHRVAELEATSATDSLTGLATRGALVGRLDGLLEQPGQGVGVVFIDLDRFKQVNDRHGHRAGDDLLAAVGNRLRAAVKQGDLIARLGGDEFAVLVRSHDAGVLEDVARRVVETLTRPYELDDVVVRIGTSAGAAAVTSDGRVRAADLLAAADEAMYAAKRAGGGVRVAEPPIVVELPELADATDATA